jgi:hypothetical protein
MGVQKWAENMWYESWIACWVVTRGLGGGGQNFSARPLRMPAMWRGYVINVGPPNFSCYPSFGSSKMLSLIRSSLLHQLFGFLFPLVLFPLS